MNRKMRVDGPFVSHGKSALKALFRLQECHISRIIYIFNDETHSAVEDFHDMYWSVIPDIHS